MIACSKFCHYASVICVFHKVQVNRFLVVLFERYDGPKVSRQFQFTHGNFNLLTASSIFSWQRSRHFWLRSPPVNYGCRVGRTQTGMSSYRSPYISFHAFTWDRPKNELRPVWLHLGRWPDTSYFRTGLRPYRSHARKTKTESQTGSINSIFLRMTPPFLLFLSKNRNTATNNISKQDLEVASMLGLIWGLAPFNLRCCALNINRPVLDAAYNFLSNQAWFRRGDFPGFLRTPIWRERLATVWIVSLNGIQHCQRRFCHMKWSVNSYEFKQVVISLSGTSMTKEKMIEKKKQ